MAERRVPADDPALPAFQRYQYAFTAHIRDPQGVARPRGVPRERMRVYNELLYNNLEGFLLACFPVCRKILGARAWKRLVRAFFSGHRCRAPLFRQIPEEFVQWLARRPVEVPDYLPHLAHYEWVELAVDTSPATVDEGAIARQGDLLTGRPVLNPAAMLVAYPYPVHRIGPRLRPDRPDLTPTRILVFRDDQDRVRFIVLNAVSARLLALLGEGRLSGRAALEAIATELRHPDPAAVVAAGAQVLEDLRAQGAIPGTARE
jgi:hypothetical protein